MASSNEYLAKPNFRFLSEERDNSFNSEIDFEFDEADVWNSNYVASSEVKESVPSSRISKKQTKMVETSDWDSENAKSSPSVDIPDWSKILREAYKRNGRRENDENEDEDGKDNRRIPPDEYLAKQLRRKGIASFSVQEGMGRTLKGRDLSRMRDAIWEKLGFQD